MKIPTLIKKIVCFIFKKRIAELQEKQILNNFPIKIIKDNLPQLKEIGITTANCPYCNMDLNKFPTKKTKCKNCQNYIYVRTRPIDNKKILVKQNEIELIEREWEKNTQINYYNATKKTCVKLKPLTIHSTKKPKIISFISDSDYRVLLNLYSCHAYGSKYNFNIILGSYPYNKYDWNVLLQIVWSYQNYYKKIQEAQKTGIKKVKLECINNCNCCKKLLKKEINIKNAPELPRKECPFKARICIDSFYYPIIKF